MLVIAEGTLKSLRDTVLAVEWASSKKKSSFKKKKKSTKKQKNEAKPKNRFQRRPMIKKSIYIAISKVTGEKTV